MEDGVNIRAVEVVILSRLKKIILMLIIHELQPTQVLVV